ncbi:GrpB family protein [Jeotgalibacillus sp. ET6]|uniref:GrpB family protein n=1 Tax=Jeotgalibacillus sp. ET6 TaxID=3037260 RepID=UPI0024182479|nr:GrpB family protein [Jeotgalibacillus sp. ET6]MDG5471230.1 GrpB family protein [Jeotgalibacillus sp. ET6]
MKLGLKRNEVKLEDYTPEWKDEFTRIKKEVVQTTEIEENRIEHIGSTAIKGMVAKPILDMIVGVNDIQNVGDKLFSDLKQTGFLRLKVERPNEIVLAKFSDETYEEKTHYIHLVEFQEELWNNLLFFRDYLNSNELARKHYLEIKLDYLKTASTGIEEYTDRKEAFVKEIFKKRNE